MPDRSRPIPPPTATLALFEPAGKEVGPARGRQSRWGLPHVIASFLLAGGLAAVAVRLGPPAPYPSLEEASSPPVLAGPSQPAVLSGETAVRFCLLLLEQAGRNLPDAPPMRWEAVVAARGPEEACDPAGLPRRLVEYPRRALGDRRVSVTMSQHEPAGGRNCYCFRFQRCTRAAGDWPAEVMIFIDERTSQPVAFQVRHGASPASTEPVESWCLRQDDRAPLVEIGPRAAP
jgi:hypothetical protein